MDPNVPPAPAWSGVIRPHAIPGLSTCLEERRLCKEGLPLPISRLEIEALSLAEWAVARGRTLVLCPADPLAPLSALIPAAVHVADMAWHYRTSGKARGSSRRVAVVTTDFRMRGFYRALGIRQPGSSSVAPLRDVVPAATLGRDGVIRVLGQDPGRGWSTVFIPSVADAAAIGQVDLVVVELPVSGEDELLNLGVPVVVLARDPADPLLLRLDGKVLIFAWDQADLTSVRGHDGLPPRLACRAEGGLCQVVAVASQPVCENAALFWQDIGALVRSSRRSAVAWELSRQAFSLFHDLVGLALPLEAYEQLTTPVRVRLDAIASAARLTKGETRDLYLPMVEVELRDLARAMGSSPPKREALLRTLANLLDEHGDVMLVARTAEMARAYVSDFSHDGVLTHVRVTSLGALSGEKPAEVAVLTGMAPTWARWVYRAGIARSLRILAYCPDGPVESVAQGFNEVDIVRRVLVDQATREKWFARPAAKDHVWSQLSGEPARVPQGSKEILPTADVADVPVIAVTPAEIPPGLWDGRRWLAPLEGTGMVGGAEPTSGRFPTDVVVLAVRVVFEDGRWALMESAGVVTRFRPNSGTADPAFPINDLKPGDQVLFFDGDSRKDLLGKVLEVAVEVPALAVAAGWVGHWRRVLAAAYRSFGSYEAFAAALRERGCTVQTQTVRLWVVGVTIGPEKAEDVRRVGIVTDDAVLLSAHQEVCRGMRSLRGAHVQLGKRLSELSRQVGPAAAAGRLAADEVIDERSGLTAADFRDSMEILTVRVIEPAGEVPYMVVGPLNQEMEEETNA